MVRHERRPGIGPLVGFRGDGTQFGRSPVNPKQLEAYIENGSFWRHELPPEQLYFKYANQAYLRDAKAMGVSDQDDKIVLHLYSEVLQKFRLAATGTGKGAPPARLRERLQRTMDPLPIWYPPVEETMVDLAKYPIHAITQRPMAMYHSWGSQNAWLRQILSENRLYIWRDLADRRFSAF